MKTLASFMANDSPKFNKEMVEGLCYHRLKNVISYVDNYIKYSCTHKTNTKLRYLGYRQLSPKDEIKLLINKNNKAIFDIAENDIFPIELIFQYGDEINNRYYYLYLPYASKGNLIKLSGTNLLVSPVLADKVISIGEHIVFINIMTAKYNFERIIYTIKINDVFKRTPIIVTRLYRNQSKKLANTTEAVPTVMHYLLAQFGYSKTCEIMLGFVPKAVYTDKCITKDKVTICSTGNKPKGYIKDKFNYATTNIKFQIDTKDFTEDVSYLLGNILYLIDNFPEAVTIDQLDNTFLWKNMLGEIIHSGNHQIAYIMEKINAHFKDINSSFDSVTYQKLLDIDINANNLIELMVIIFKNFNTWILSADVKTIYNNKAYECELYVLSKITSAITRAVLDISKEELRLESKMLESKTVDKILNMYLRPKIIFSLKKEILYVSSVNYSGDHLYPKNTSIITEQQSDPISAITATTNISERKKITASMITTGCILGLPKKNPVPVIRLNPFVTTNKSDGTVLPHPVYNDIIEKTNMLFSNIVDLDIKDISLINIHENDDNDIDNEKFESDDDNNDDSDSFTIED